MNNHFYMFFKKQLIRTMQQIRQLYWTKEEIARGLLWRDAMVALFLESMKKPAPLADHQWNPHMIDVKQLRPLVAQFVKIDGVPYPAVLKPGNRWEVKED